jgi:hypothetical protein
MKTAGRALAWVVVIAAGLATALLLVLAAVSLFDSREGNTIEAALILGAITVAFGGAAWLAQRRLGDWRRSRPAVPLLEAAERGETVELRSGRRSDMVNTIVCFAGGGALLADGITGPYVGSVVLGVLLVSLGVHGVLLLPRGFSTLHISPEGLVMRWPLRTRRAAWDEIERFRVMRLWGVGFNLRSAGRVRLPSRFGLDPADMAERLDRLRTRYTARS